MPFAELPGSTGFVPPPAPRWEPFAAQAINAIANQPVQDTAGLVQNAVAQINKILEYNSPREKKKRLLEDRMTDAQIQLYDNYTKNPKDYELDAKGNIRHKDPATFYRNMGAAYNAYNAQDRYDANQERKGKINAFLDSYKQRQDAAEAVDKQHKDPSTPTLQPWRPKLPPPPGQDAELNLETRPGTSQASPAPTDLFNTGTDLFNTDDLLA